MLKYQVYVVDIVFSNFKWMARHRTPTLAVVATDHINQAVQAFGIAPGVDSPE